QAVDRELPLDVLGGLSPLHRRERDLGEALPLRAAELRPVLSERQQRERQQNQDRLHFFTSASTHLKPTASSLKSTASDQRNEHVSRSALSFQLPPRITRRFGLPSCVQAEPSLGAPS